MIYPICIKFVWRRLEFAFLRVDESRRAFYFPLREKNNPYEKHKRRNFLWNITLYNKTK